MAARRMHAVTVQHQTLAINNFHRPAEDFEDASTLPM
jgi:hypothetical protein